MSINHAENGLLFASVPLAAVAATSSDELVGWIAIITSFVAIAMRIGDWFYQKIERRDTIQLLQSSLRSAERNEIQLRESLATAHERLNMCKCGQEKRNS